jgi:hypothetical protein
MNFVRGTFRLSILAAFLTAVYAAIASHLSGLDAAEKSWRIWSTLRCGEQFLNRDMTAFTNEFGLIDIGKAGCSESRFLATVDEIRTAVRTTDDASQAYTRVFKRELISYMGPVILVFILINLAGFLFLASRTAWRWVIAGYREGG